MQNGGYERSGSEFFNIENAEKVCVAHVYFVTPLDRRIASHRRVLRTIRFAIWCDQSKAIAEKTSGKIRLDQTNSQISRISALNTPGNSKRLFMSIWPKHPGTGITLTANRSKTHMILMYVSAARQ